MRTETEINNLTMLKTYLRDRLRNSSKQQSLDAYGNVIYIDVEIFSDAMLDNFLSMSLSDFNQMPAFTDFTFEDTKQIKRFSAILVDGAVLYALSSQALIEKGREFAFVDDGITFNPPSIADIMMTQYHALLPIHWEKLKIIKKAFYIES